MTETPAPDAAEQIAADALGFRGPGYARTVVAALARADARKVFAELDAARGAEPGSVTLPPEAVKSLRQALARYRDDLTDQEVRQEYHGLVGALDHHLREQR